MPTPRGYGPIVSTAPITAVGEGAVPLTLAEAYPLVTKAKSKDELRSIVERLRPRPNWTRGVELTMGLGGPLPRAIDWVETQIDSDMAAARVGGKKKLSRKRNARRRRTRRH